MTCGEMADDFVLLFFRSNDLAVVTTVTWKSQTLLIY